MQSKNMIVSSFHQQQQEHNHLQSQPQPQSQLQQLKCPRCDSSNTKFCYYNNYSLSQPRHFCKACKRYWTRGGTLRNVPVGGSYRKNKRVKRPTNATGTIASAASTAINASPNNPHHFSSMNHHPMFYGLSDHCNDSLKTSSSIGLENGLLSYGFSGHALGHPHHMSPSFINNSRINKPFLLSGLLSSSTSPPSSTLLQHIQKPINNGREMMGQSYLKTLESVQDLHVGSTNKDINKEEKLNQISENINGIMSSSSLDHSNYDNIWNNAIVVNGAWLDPTNNNVGSSLSSLL